MSENLEICQLGHPILRQVAQPIVHLYDASLQQLVHDMMTTLVSSKAVGIAAPQVGVSQRLMIIASHPNERYPNAPRMEPTPMINPRIVDHSDDVVRDWEGCLSIPGLRGFVPRYAAVEVEYTTLNGKLQQCVLEGFVARIFQHEFDHLEGQVFLQRLDNLAENLDQVMTDDEYRKRIVRIPVEQ
jgi:peptide deformylase